MNFQKIYETAAEKLGVSKSAYEDVKKAAEDLETSAWSLVEAIGSLEKTDKLDLQLRTTVQVQLSTIVQEIEELKKAVETGKLP